MQKHPESVDKRFVLRFNLSHKLQLLNVQHNDLLSDVLHCTNMNTDFIDFRK